MILANHGIVSSSGALSFDADALAFISAASITDNTQKTAVNTLVTDLKAYNIWTKMKAIYPFVGGSATSHKYNLKDPRDLDAAFRLTFSGGWTHSSTGALPNGTNAFANTFFQPNSVLASSTSVHMSKYNRTNDLVGNKVDGTFDSIGSGFLQQNYSAGVSIIGTISNLVSYSQTDTRGFFTITRTSSTVLKQFKNNTQQGTTNTVSNTLVPNTNIYIGARNDNNVGAFYNSYDSSFFSLGDGLSDTDVSNLYTAVQLYQTTLSRNV